MFYYRNCKILFIIISSISICPAAEAGKMLPAGLNPVQAGIKTNGFTEKALSIFDASPSSRRHYDLIDPLDGATVGLGNTPQAQLVRFFADLHADRGASEALRIRLTEFYQVNTANFSRAANKFNINDGKSSVEIVGQILNLSIFSETYMSRYQKNCRKICKKGQANFYKEHKDWLIDGLRYAFRDEDIVRWQLRYWEKDVLAPAREKAVRAGLSSDAGAIGLAMAESSAQAWASHIAGGPKRGYIKAAGMRWPWNKHPFHESPTSEQLENWRLVAQWQYYCSKTKRLRSRSRAFYKTYLADDWTIKLASGGSACRYGAARPRKNDV